MRALPLLLVGCYQVPLGAECLLLTEVSASKPGTVEFDPWDCSVVAVHPTPETCDPPSATTMNEHRFCPDWFELCNETAHALEAGDFRVVNHDDTNLFGPESKRLPERTIAFGDCLVVAAVEGSPNAACALCPQPSCAVGLTFDQELGGRLLVTADEPEHPECEQRLFEFFRPTPRGRTLHSANGEVWSAGAPSPGER